MKILLILSLFCMSLFSAVSGYKSLDNLVREADGIIQGHVKKVKFKKTKDNFIYTFVTLDIPIGSYYLGFIVDSNNNLVESNENNNFVAVPQEIFVAY